jgi:hypothetical protein
MALEKSTIDEIRELSSEDLKQLNSVCVAEMNYRHSLATQKAKAQLHSGQTCYVYSDREGMHGVKVTVMRINRTKATCRFEERGGRFGIGASVNVPLEWIKTMKR